MRHVGMPAGQRRSTLSGVHTNCKESNRDDRKQDRTPLYSLTDFCPHSLIHGTAIRSNSPEYRISVDSQAPENGLRKALAERTATASSANIPTSIGTSQFNRASATDEPIESGRPRDLGQPKPARPARRGDRPRYPSDCDGMSCSP